MIPVTIKLKNYLKTKIKILSPEKINKGQYTIENTAMSSHQRLQKNCQAKIKNKNREQLI